MAIAELRTPDLTAYLSQLSETLTGAGDQANIQILNNLKQKYQRQEVVVACCGYVSAGKSRLLNLLNGSENLLPVSPLPASRNTVHIRPAKEGNLWLWRNNHCENIPSPESELIAASCQDPEVDKLELAWPSPMELSLIDTPGIDSLEGGNQLAENPTLLQADLVIYLTDYNHVQSQVNFNFLKILQAREIPYVLVVNQIDKHVPLELSLEQFRARLMQALEQWDLKPLGLYFTSLLIDKHPDCQLGQLKDMLAELSSAGPRAVLSTVLRSAREVLRRHGEFCLAGQEALREPHLWVNEQARSEQAVVHAFRQVQERINNLTSLAETIHLEIMGEVTKLLDNAPLFSFETRELAKKLLEARQPGFKAGLFAGAAKTMLEQENRLNHLHSDLVTRAEANLTWHLRKILADIPKRYNLPDTKYAAEAAQMNVEFEPKLVLQTVRPGALVSGEYVMNYTGDLAAEIKLLYRQASLEWIKRAQAVAKEKLRYELADLEKEADSYGKILESFAKLKELDDAHSTYMTELLSAWEQVAAKSPTVSFRDSQVLEVPTIQPGNSPTPSSFPQVSSRRRGQIVKIVHPKLRAMAGRLQHSAELLEPLPGFDLWVRALHQRAERLENNLFTVALFGAFSAGKSSLANALLGEAVLPVSPNPTTAAINKILPPTEQYPHGTIKVRLKTLSDLTADVLASLAVFGLTAQDLADAMTKVRAMESQDVPPEAKPHQSFLRAVLRGQASLLKHMGEELVVEFAEFGEFVVQEDKACFVESIELYLSCPLTDLGIVLVDTPGSNSTNARHTNVAFDYIKNADAVLFVTYYNNAFCKADAQFLSQLGKVKDTFALDKMFFLVNAADLAQTPAELSLVLKHVEQNLRTCDILHPRIFAVSSQLALLAKIAAAGALQADTEQMYRQRLKLRPGENLPAVDKALVDSGLKQFETCFFSFIEGDLINLASEAADKEIARNLHHVNSLLAAAKTDAAEKTERLQYNRNVEQKVLAGIASISLQVEESSIGQEIDELLYYVNQRFSYRFSELFDRNFVSLAQPREKQPRQAAQLCLRELLQDMEIELAQEMRATSLRVEKFLRKSLDLVLSKLTEVVLQHEQQLRLQNQYEGQSPGDVKLPTLSWESQALAGVPGLYKNPKDWVEGKGRNNMREAVRNAVQPQIFTWLNACGNSMKQHFGEFFIQSATLLKEEIGTEVVEYYSGVSAALENVYDVCSLENVRESIKKLLGE